MNKIPTAQSFHFIMKIIACLLAPVFARRRYFNHSLDGVILGRGTARSLKLEAVSNELTFRNVIDAYLRQIQ